MEPSPTIVDTILLPHGAFSEVSGEAAVDANQTAPPSDSLVNTECETESSDEVSSALWDVDGGETDRGLFCTVPTFARGKPPLRVTTSISWDKVEYSAGLEQALDIEAFFRAGKWNFRSLPLTRHLRKALAVWSQQRPQ